MRPARTATPHLFSGVIAVGLAAAILFAGPLLLCMLVDGQFYDEAGISGSARECYFRRLCAPAQQYNFVLAEFEQHDENAIFPDHRVPRMRRIAASHLTVKGQTFCDHVLDSFFMGLSQRVDQVSMFYLGVPQLGAGRCYRI